MTPQAPQPPHATAPPDAAATVRAYHERTKHHLQRYAAGPDTLDWDAQPNPFRRWTGAPLLELPLQADGCGVRWNDLFRPDAIAPQALTMPALGLLFELALGLAAWKVFGPDRWAVRCNPSSGNLHPTEGWLISHGVPGVADGVHHYAPHEHALEQRASARVSPTCNAPTTEGCRAPWSPPEGPRAWIALSSVLWREAWKYGERAFRYCQIDAGHAVGALRYAAAVLGWSLRPVELDTNALASLLGLDRDADFGAAEREEPEVLLELVLSPTRPDTDTDTDTKTSAQATTAAPVLVEATWHGRPNRLDRHPMYRWPVIDAVAQASRHASAKGLISPPSLAIDPAGPTSPPVLARSPQGPEPSKGFGSAHPSTAPRLRGDEPAARLIRQRRGAQHFDRRATAPLKQILPLLCAIQSRTLPLDTGPKTPRVHAVVFAHRVDGLEPGAYLLPRREAALPELHALLGGVAEWQRCTDAEALARANGAGPLTLIRLAANPALAGALRTIDCHQALGSDAILAFSLLGEFDTALAGATARPCGYRELLQEAGLVGQALYMEAEAAGLAGTGIGCYFDDALHQLLSLTDTRLQALYHFTIGVPMHDSRIASEAPYAHRSPASTGDTTMTAPPPAEDTAAPSRSWSRLTADEVPGHLARHPDALILDARDERSHAQAHLPGSVRLDGRNHERLLLRENRQRPVFIYCYHGNSSQTYAQMFSDFGFGQVHDLVGGWTAWAQSGHALPPAAADAHTTGTGTPATRTPGHRPMSPELAQWLAREGFGSADPEAAGPHGNTPLMHAAWRGQHHRVDELLDLGVRLDAVNGDGNNALWLACVNGEPGLIRALVARGVPLDHPNAVGATCLMYASSAGKPEVVRTLLDLGANPHLTSQDDFSALDMAASVECLQMLRAATRRAP